MSDLVVDSSVAVKWVLPEEDSDRARHISDEVARSGGRLITLDLTYVEVANAVWKRFHRRLQSDAETRAVIDVFGRLNLSVEPVSRVLSAGVDVALRYDRAVYDARFVALVAAIGADGVTADSRSTTPFTPTSRRSSYSGSGSVVPPFLTPSHEATSQCEVRAGRGAVPDDGSKRHGRATAGRRRRQVADALQGLPRRVVQAAAH